MTEREYYWAFWAIILTAYDLWEVGSLQRQADRMEALYSG